MNRFEKLDWLYMSCSENFIKEVLPLEMCRWMGEDEFEKFYDHLCRMWEIKREEELAKEDEEILAMP
jgi:hypothetical protein